MVTSLETFENRRPYTSVENLDFAVEQLRKLTENYVASNEKFKRALGV